MPRKSPTLQDCCGTARDNRPKIAAVPHTSLPISHSTIVQSQKQNRTARSSQRHSAGERGDRTRGDNHVIAHRQTGRQLAGGQLHGGLELFALVPALVFAGGDDRIHAHQGAKEVNDLHAGAFADMRIGMDSISAR